MDTVYTEIRLLLTLWDIGAGQGLVKRSELLRRTCKGKEKADICQEILLKLRDEGAITLSEDKVVKAALTDAGLQRLANGLLKDNFEFVGQLVGSRLANAGLKWFRQNQGLVVGEAIASDTSTDESVAAEG